MCAIASLDLSVHAACAWQPPLNDCGIFRPDHLKACHARVYGWTGVVLCSRQFSAIKPEERMGPVMVFTVGTGALLAATIFLITIVPRGNESPGSAKLELEMPGHGGGVRP